MLDPKFVLANLAVVKKAIEDKKAANDFTDVDEFVTLDERRKKVVLEVEALKAEKNKISKEIGVLMGKLKGSMTSGSDDIAVINTMVAELQKNSKAKDDRIKELDAEQSKIEARRDAKLAWIPNIPHESVPQGRTATENVTVRTWGDVRSFSFEPKPHYELGEKLKILDTERGAKISGSGWYFLRGDGARMERALISWFLDVHRERNGYEELFPPFFVTEKTLYGSGQFPKFQDQMYFAQLDNLYAIPTAEVPLTSMHQDEVLEEKDLPRKYVAYSACFRREAGAAGADTRGILRVHQFNKCEMLKLTTPKTSYAEHEAMLENAEHLLKELGLQYRVLLLCRGDLSFSAAKCYDLEVYAPAAQKWLEVSSVSNFEDYQARRANLRFRPAEGGKLQYVHTLNGSGLALPRIMVALWEANQNADGSITIPAVLRKYMNGQEKIAAK
ncbi:MAG TPA: serine--tRNA ligase [Planctomycetota bacterium]|nr:serine--tRNA ligase [Planctomycetota bacterium]